MSARRAACLFASAVLALGVARDAWGQVSLEASFRSAKTGNVLLANPRGLHLAIRRKWGLKSAWLGAERLDGSGQRFGSPCSGLINPEDTGCNGQPITDESRMRGGEVGISTSTPPSGRMTLEIMGAFRITQVSADSRGMVSGRRKSATKAMWGPEGGLSLTYALMKRPRVALVVSGRAAGLMPIVFVQVEDGYEPFDPMGARSLNVGLRFQP